jgi:tetratricopeptide (TPR) repeat protein/CHAT domain-containing protein
MRSKLAVASLSLALCLLVSRVGAETWQDLLSRTDSLAAAGYADSADAALEAALSSALTQHARSETTVEFALYENDETRRYYFPSYADAESLYARVIRVKERVVGQDDPGYAKLLNDLGELYVQHRRHQEADFLFKRALAIREKALGPDHADVAGSLSSLATLYRAQGRYLDAAPLYERALAIREKALGPDHLVVARSLNNLAALYWDQGRYSEAEPLYKRALAIREKALGPNHPDVAASLNNLAILYCVQGRYSEAEPLLERAIAINEKTLGPDHPGVAASLQNLAALYRDEGRYSEVEPLYKRALAISERALGPDHPDVARSLNNLAGLYDDQGRYSEAEPLHKRALAIREKALRPDHPDVAVSLNNLANLYRDQGRYSESEPLFERALAMSEKALGPDHPDVATSLNNLAILYWNQGRYSEAEPLHKRALAIREKALGPEHPDVAASLGNLAAIYLDQGRYSEAEPLYRRALAMREKALGPDHPDVAASLDNLAETCHYQGRYSEAEPLYDRALTIKEKALGPDHPDVAASLGNLAALYYVEGRYSEAEPVYKRALAINEKTLGPNHPGVAASLESFCDLYRWLGKYADAVDLAGRACSIRHKNFVENSIGLSENDALTFSRFLRISLSNYLSCYRDLGSTNPATALEAADLVLACKGQVSDGILERQKSIVEGADSTTLSLAESLRYARFRLAKLFVEGPGEDVSAYRAEVDSLDRFSKQLEADLSRRSASFRGYEAYRNVNADRITSLLPQNSVLAEYVRYGYHDLELKRDIAHYLVIVIATDGEPRVVDLGESSQIDSVIGTYRSHMLRVATSGRMASVVDEQEYRGCARDLYGIVWRPIEQYISGRALVFIAPDGALNMISFAGLVDKDGNYLIEKYPIQYVSAGRDLVRLTDETRSGAGLLALGDPDYNATASSRSQQPATPAIASTEPAYGTTRNVRSGCGRLKDLSAPLLPGTRKEVEMISSKWKKISHEPASIYFGSDASEERFKMEAHGKRVIHLATHGYFLEGACQPDVPEGRLEAGSGLGREAGYVGENPLLLSGLLLASANLHGEGADSLGCEDGILTAYEVSAMNLEGTELVVLSACETGLGEVKEGEGVYGLRRAFQMAGARTVVSALWPVSDEATAEMMGQLYDRGNRSLPETIRNMQLKKIKELRHRGQPDHPFTWAGFISLGDWR